MATGAHASRPAGLAPHLSLSTDSPPVTLTPQARRTFQESFAKFEKTVVKRSKDDQRDFADTTLRDVWEAVGEIERLLAARQCLRNMKRLEPFLNGLEAYAKVVEVLCNGTPFMPWIWLASDHISAFETLISAYAQIAENLPRFDRLRNAFRNHPDFQQLIAVVYSDILEFHRQAYKFFRKSGWKTFFKSSWGQFDSRFSSILASMQRHASLVDKEANAYSIAEVMVWRKEAREAAVKVEKERSAAKLVATLSWLGNLLTCIDQIPGISSVHSEPVMFILATLVSQILRQNIKLSTYVYEEFVAAARSPSTRELQQILSNLIPQLDSPRILIDGIDECIHYGSDGLPRNLAPVKDVIHAILQLEHYGSESSSPKILLASRDIFQITGRLSRKPVLSLDDESEIMTNAIRCFTKQGFREIEERFKSFPNAQIILNQAETRIVSKSQGMFLWVRLVLSHLEQEAYSMDDLEEAVASLPVTLNEFRAISAINWMLCARRPLRAVELQDAITFAMGSETLTENNKLSVTVLDHCKPLVQLHADGHVSFVHFTVQEELEGMLYRLLDTIDHYQKQNSKFISQLPVQDYKGILSMEPRLQYMRRYGDIFRACVDIVQHRHVRKLQFHDASSTDRLPDPTPFSTIKAEYEVNVNTLLATSTFPGLSSVELATFHSLYQPFALVCRYPGCTNISAGFATHIDRGRHEMSHAPPLSCVYSGCKYTLPFNSLQSLKRHIRESQDGISRCIPESVRSARGHNAPSSSRFTQKHGTVEIRPQSSMTVNHSPGAFIIDYHTPSPVSSADCAPKEDARSRDTNRASDDPSKAPDHVYLALTKIMGQLVKSQDSWSSIMKQISARYMDLNPIKEKLASRLYPTPETFLFDVCTALRSFQVSYLNFMNELSRQEPLKAMIELEDSMWNFIRQLKPVGAFNPLPLHMMESAWRVYTVRGESPPHTRENLPKPIVITQSSPLNLKKTVVSERTIDVGTTHTESPLHHLSVKPSESPQLATGSLGPCTSTKKPYKRHSLIMALNSTNDTELNPILSGFIRSYHESGHGLGIALEWHQLIHLEERGRVANYCYTHLHRRQEVDMSAMSEAFGIEVHAFAEAHSKEEYIDIIEQKFAMEERGDMQQPLEDETQAGDSRIAVLDPYGTDPSDLQTRESGIQNLESNSLATKAVPAALSASPDSSSDLLAEVPGTPRSWPPSRPSFPGRQAARTAS
ncbi:conserved hypothetical protein [Pyrenophora tritici-repentis Pt-1C-BFP]|uniref:Uncharacterized protein n=2 Tax=Pyrenophora tritici-repentis TaxID=45151 RepID=B2WJ44_PYRTR|nr:uncharacterized protein PTRG_10003 [Pyrenophora tritici-repentis Pt-1C-BFP]EDU43054.1 conserved hypothetical protein [Pyrenophora tritici-repentis Pt-1C-BFP]